MSNFNPTRRRARLVKSAKTTIENAIRAHASGIPSIGEYLPQKARRRPRRILGANLDAAVVEAFEKVKSEKKE